MTNARHLAALALALPLAHCGGGSNTDAAVDHAIVNDSPAHDVPVSSDVAMDGGVVDDNLGTMDVPVSDVPVADTPAPTDTADAGRDYGADASDFGLGGASRCSAAHLQLCENFETGSLDTSLWTVNGTHPTIDGTHTARGTHALHVLQMGNGASYIRESRTFPETNDTYWGRMFVYFHQLPQTAMGYAHWTFAAASGTGIPGEIRLSGQLHGTPDVNNFGVGTDSAGHTGDWTNSDTDSAGHLVAVPTDRWLCIEWLHDGQHNVTRFFTDGVEQTSMATTVTMHGTGSGSGPDASYVLPQFNQLWVGWQEYQPSTETFELWMDEIGVDSARIGCVL